MNVARIGGLMPNGTDWLVSRIERDATGGIFIRAGAPILTSMPKAEVKRLARKSVVVRLSPREAADLVAVITGAI